MRKNPRLTGRGLNDVDFTRYGSSPSRTVGRIPLFIAGKLRSSKCPFKYSNIILGLVTFISTFLISAALVKKAYE